MVALEIARQMTDNFNEEKRVAEVVLSLFSKIAQEVKKKRMRTQERFISIQVFYNLMISMI